MRIIAYIYADPAIESVPDANIWGLEIDRVYRDLGDRAQLQQLLQDCKTNPPDYLLLRRLDELGDTLNTVATIVAQIEAVGTSIIATEQHYHSFETNQQDPSGDRLFDLLAEIQQNQYSRRIRQGHARNRIKVMPPPGKATYGYRRGKDRYILDRSTAPVVKDFFEHYLLYSSLRGSVRYLEKKYGKKISVTTGRRWLTNPIYRGDTKYHNGDILPNTHTAILSREEAAQIDRLLKRNSRLPSRSASAPRSLAGLVICGQCYSHHTITRVTARKKSKEYLYLRPVSCPEQNKCKAIPYQDILEQTIAQICQILPLAIAGMNAPERSSPKGAIAAQMAQKETIMQQLPDLQKQGILDAETADLRHYKLRTELSQLQQKLSQLPPDNLKPIAQEISFPQFWLDLSETERRFYFREFIKHIKIIRDLEQQWHLELVFIFSP
ncbi:MULTISPECIES: recombinase family protein [Spirulina sp. CCY15215]|uniref:recombinase family protein n=1 Tax=Spirulina sp. CCY15215 TaxID=2767591 RepID=UPI0032B01AC1